MLLSVLLHRLKYALFLIFFVCNKGILCDPKSNQNKYTKAHSASEYVDKSHLEETETLLLEGCNEDMACLIRASEDRQGLDAIRALHRQLDDDENGAVDLSESNDFLRGELKYEKDAERRQKAFHRNDDMHISVKELWEAWVKSEASASTTPVGSPSRQHDRSAAPGPDSEQPKKKARVEESEIERLRRELRSKKNEVERLSSKRAKEAKEQRALKKELEELRSVAKRRRCALERRIGELAERRGEGALECVLAVRLRSLPHALYAFRLDLGRLAPTVMDRLEEVDEFLFWYATDDAQRDFEEAKSAADGVAGSRAHVRLQTTPNAIRVVAADGGAPAAADEAAELARNVATAVEGALRAMGLLEMDVGVLRALFRDQRPDDLNEFVVNASSEIVRTMYIWLCEAHSKESRNYRI